MKTTFINNNLLLKYLFYPLALFISKFISGSKIKPTHITYIWYILILSSLFLNTKIQGIYILILFLIAYFLDCLDGQYARLTNQTSEKGKLIDDLGGDIFLVLFWFNCGLILNSELDVISNNQLSIFICALIFIKTSFALRSVHIEQNKEIKLNEEEYDIKVISLKRLLKMPFSFGELMWPIVFIFYFLNLLHIYMVFYAIYVFLLMTLNIRKVFATMDNN